METSNLNCKCQNFISPNNDARIVFLEKLRKQCPVLQLLLPEEFWKKYKKTEFSPRDKAFHISIIFNSLLEGDLGKLTSPIHRFLFNGDKLKDNLAKHYRKVLNEKWIFESGEKSRHKKSKEYQGILVELQIAEWLEQRGSQIENLEALGGQSDIQSIESTNAVKSNIEVKFIGQRDEEFQHDVNFLHGKRTGGRAPMRQVLNYIIFRTYEAAHQLQNCTGNRIAIIVIDRSALLFSNIVFKNDFIDWNNLAFIDLGEELQSLIGNKKNKRKYPTIYTDLSEKIKTINEVWIVVKDRHSYNLKLRHQWNNKCA